MSVFIHEAEDLVVFSPRLYKSVFQGERRNVFMAENDTSLASLYKGWDAYQEQLVKAITPLTAEQLALRVAPQLRSVSMIAAHIIGARVRWFHRLMGEGSVNIQIGRAHV